MNNNNPIKYSDLIKPDDSITKLIEQLKALETEYVGALEKIKLEAKELAVELKKVSGATEEGRERTKKATTDAEKLAAAAEKLKFAQSDTAKELAVLNQAKNEANRINKITIKLNESEEGSYNKLSAQYSLNKIRLNQMSAAKRSATAEGQKLEKETKELYEQMKNLQESTGKTSLNVGNYTESIKDALANTIPFGNSIVALADNGEEAGGFFQGMINGGKALGATLKGLMANPAFLVIAGVAAVGASFKFWYDYNAGLVEATRLTQQFTSKQGADLKAYRNEVQGVADVFGAEFKEVLVASNALSKQFGISAEEALGLVKDGFVAGGNANGEFIDSLKEYPAYFKEAGVSAEQFVAIVAETNKSGIFSDKGIDAIKEANIRLREMTPATEAALDAIGISSAKVQEDLQNGSKTTFQVMQDVSARLAELPDSAAVVGTAIADIFGGPGEDAGLQYLRTLKDIEGDLDLVKNKAGELGKLQEEQLRSQVDLNNAISAVFDQTGGTFERMTTGVKVFINDGLTGIITGFINIANYFVEMYNNSLAFRAVWQSVVLGFKTSVQAIGGIFGFLGDIIQSTGKMLKGAFTLDWEEFKEGAVGFATALPNLVKAQMKGVSDNFREGVENLEKQAKPIVIPITTQGTSSATSSGASGSVGVETQEKTKVEPAKVVENAYKKNLEAVRKYEDAKLALEVDSDKKAREIVRIKYARQIEDLKYQLATEEGLNAEGRKAINATIEVLEKEQTNELIKLEEARQLALLEQQKKGIELRLASAVKGSEQERKLRLELLEVERATELLKGGDSGATDAKFAAGAAALADEYLVGQMAIYDAQQELAQSEFDLLKNSEGEKTRFRLQAEKDRLNKILALNKEAGNKLTDIEVQTIQNTIAKIDQEISQSRKEDRAEDVYSVFGLNLDDEKKAAINESVSYAINALNEILAARLAAAEQAVSSAEKEVESAKSALDAEITARSNGYANNVLMAQKEYDLAKKNQDKALAEQERAQKQQARINTLTQISSLITGAAMIWGQLGFPWAIPALAVMFGSFAASKLIAANYASESYGDGTVELLSGGSHQSGNDVDLGVKADGTRRRAEGGEFFAVINKRNSRKFRKHIPNVINSLNDGSFASKYLNAYAQEGLTLNLNGNSPDLTQLSSDVRDIRDQNKRRYYTDANGARVEVYKNLKRKVK